MFLWAGAMVHFNLTMYSNTNVGEKVNFVATASQHRSTSVAEESMLIRNSFVLTTFISSGGSFRVDCLVLTTFSSTWGILPCGLSCFDDLAVGDPSVWIVSKTKL